jgi:hypothetical protein
VINFGVAATVSKSGNYERTKFTFYFNINNGTRFTCTNQPKEISIFCMLCTQFTISFIEISRCEFVPFSKPDIQRPLEECKLINVAHEITELQATHK